MSRKFQTIILSVAMLFAASAGAVVTSEWRVNLLKGSATIATITGASADEAWQKCRDAIPQTETVSTTYRCQTLTYAAVVEPDPVCPPPPTSEQRSMECPSGTVGSWEQTSTSTVGPLPDCVVSTIWSPSEPPAGTCLVPNSPPTISGSPIAAVEAGQSYIFTPIVADPDGDTLGFTIQNRPTWANFDPSTGALSGTPAIGDIGISSSIKITVSDGDASASTPAFSITVTAPPPPPPIWNTADVGAVAAAGSTTASDATSITIKGSGADIWASADEFHFAYKQLGGDGELIARVTSITNQNQWTKVGLMVRESTAAGSRHATMFLASTRGDSFQYRVNNGGTSGGDNGDNVLTRPRWLKITRAGDVLRGFFSDDGVTWTQRGTITLAGLPANVLIGFAMTSHIDGTLATATLDSIVLNAGGTTANSPPTISGTPTASIMVGQPYTFTPQAADADADALSFAISNKPAWSAFETATGKLSGTPAAAGVFSNIGISVSDGAASAALPAFTITVTAGPAIGSATVSWSPPTQNTDGTALTNLGGYRLRYGTSETSLVQTIEIPNPSVSSRVVTDLAAGTWFFAVVAYNTSGAESANSNIAQKTL